MSRPPTYGRRVSAAVRFEPELLARLRQEAERRDVSANLLITRAVMAYLDRLASSEATA